MPATAKDGRQTAKRILIADDDEDTRVIVASVVSILGYTPLVAAGGQEAIEIFEREVPDLAILDYMMPDVTGVEVCQRIRQHVDGETIPVLILTARDTVADKVSALEEGVDDYITKPFHYQELQARVKALLRIRDLSRRLQAKNNELMDMQVALVEQERQLAVHQLAGTAAHQLGQPLSAILLNCYLLEQLPKNDARFIGALAAIKSDAKRMGDMIDLLREVKASQREGYYGDTEILKLEKDQKPKAD